MATSNIDFANAVRNWSDKARENLVKVFRLSFQYTLNDMIAYTPTRTGYLKASIQVSNSAMPLINPRANGKGVAISGPDTAGIVASAALGSTLYAGYTAAYAPRIEYGFNGTDSKGRTYSQSGRGMVRLAVQRYRINLDAAARAVNR